MFFSKILLLFILCLSSIAHAEEFLAGTSDIPVMNGLKINTSEQMDFDTPIGQVLILEGISVKKTGNEILNFYKNTLPQMGWEEKSEGIFIRQKDSLTISVLKNNNPAKVRFDISLTADK